MRVWAIALALFVLACGAPQAVPRATVTRPAKAPIATAAPTAVSHKYLTHAAMGDAWPLSVEEGTIICSGASILLRTNRGLFAVNGTARAQRRWKDIRDITKTDPKTGLLMSVQPIVDNGLEVCK
jgi:Protein of unknown function (DUF2511)